MLERLELIGLIPLAGPHFDGPDGVTKAERPFQGIPLLRRVLETRPWWRSGQLVPEDLIFILRDTACSRRFHETTLRKWYPKARVLFLSHLSQGAALSTLAGVGCITDFTKPMAVDLCDIAIEGDIDPCALFSTSPFLGGAAVTFTSNLPRYSYLLLDSSGNMVAAREKQVISEHASAGVYFFRSSAVFLRALAHSLDHASDLAFRDHIFVCPTLNGVVAQGLQVRALPARSVIDVASVA